MDGHPFPHVREIKSLEDALSSPLPHFLKAEQYIFAYWVKQSEAWGLYAFDVPLPRARLTQYVGKLPPSILGPLKYLTAKKIDALRIDGRNVWIIEVKRRPLPSGIGQLITYKELFARTYPGYRISRLVYVVPVDDEDLRRIAARNGISMEVVKNLEFLAVRY